METAVMTFLLDFALNGLVWGALEIPTRFGRPNPIDFAQYLAAQ